MGRANTIRVVLVLAALSFTAAGPSFASSNEFKVIVNPANPTTVVDREWLRDAFLKKIIAWKHGPAIQPIDLAAPAQTREQFAKEVLQKTPASLRAYWVQRIFSGVGLPPQEVGSPSSVIAYVLGTPGAVAYLPVDVDPGGAKVVDVD